MRSVQEDDNYCFTGATARSLDWLNRTKNLGANRTAQEMYGDLKGLGTSKPNDNHTKAREKWIGLKNTYARSKSSNTIVTKDWDSGGWLDPIAGIAESGGNLSDWLTSEWNHGEDIELTYNWSDGAHIVTLVDFYKQGGKTFVKYRDDEIQGNNNLGDGVGGDAYPAVKTAEVYADAGGVWHFGSDANKITWAVSESVPEPQTLVLLSVGLLLLLRKRHV
jgi:hypothetical protein